MTNATDEAYKVKSPKSYFAMVYYMAIYELTPNELRLYCHLIRRAGDDGSCWESVPNMAKLLGMHENTVRQLRNKLEEKRYIEVQSRIEGNVHKTNLIHIVDLYQRNLDFMNSNPLPHLEGVGIQNVPPLPIQNVPGVGIQNVPKVEPIEEEPIKEEPSLARSEKKAKEQDTKPNPLGRTKPDKANKKSQAGARGGGRKSNVEDSDRVLDELERTIGTSLLKWHIKTMPWSQEQVARLDRVRLQLQVACEDRAQQLTVQHVLDFINWYYTEHKDSNGVPWTLPGYDKIETYFTRWLDIAYAPPKPDVIPMDIEITYRSIQL